MYKRVGIALDLVVDTAADDWLTPGHIYRKAGTAFPDGPQTDVRAPDGIRLTQAGELWYAAALLRIELPGSDYRAPKPPFPASVARRAQRSSDGTRMTRDPSR